jgi:hypothetical protein
MINTIRKAHYKWRIMTAITHQETLDKQYMAESARNARDLADAQENLESVTSNVSRRAIRLGPL